MNSLLRDKGESVLTIPEKAPVLKADVDSTLKYFLIYLALGFSSAVWFSYLFNRFNNAPDAGMIWQVASVAAFFLLVLMFQSFFIQSFYFNLILVALDTIGLMSFFFRPFSFWFVLAFLAFILMWVIGFYAGKYELNRSLKLNFWLYSRFTLLKIITGMALLIAFSYAGIYVRSGGVSYEAYKFTISGLPGLEYASPNFTPNTSAIAVAIQEKIAAATNTQAKSNESILEYGYRLSLQGINYLQANGLGFLIVAAIVALAFFGIKGVMFFVQWPLLLLTLLIYFGLLSIGVITVETEAREKEVAVIH